MASVSARLNARHIEKLLTDAQKKQLPKVYSATINETARGTRTDLASVISENTSLKKSQVSTRNNSLYVSRRASPRSQVAVISGSRETKPFDAFKGKPTALKRKNAVRVNIKGKRRNIQRATVIDGKVKARGQYSGGSFKFDGRRKYKTLKSLSVGSQFEQDYVESRLDPIVQRRLTPTFERNFRRIVRL